MVTGTSIKKYFHSPWTHLRTFIVLCFKNVYQLIILIEVYVHFSQVSPCNLPGNHQFECLGELTG